MPGVVEQDVYTGWDIRSFKQPAARNGFGVTVTAPIDLNDLSERDFKALEALVYKHRVVVLKNQKGLRPAKQQELGYRLDPRSPSAVASSEVVKLTAARQALSIRLTAKMSVVSRRCSDQATRQVPLPSRFPENAEALTAVKSDLSCRRRHCS